jgi:hypothetical protein
MTTIKLRPREFFLERGITIPGYIWQERPFTFKPDDFAVGGDRLQERIFSADKQEDSLQRWVDDPTRAIIYAVASAPSDQRAKFFATYLVQKFIANAPLNRTVRWEALTSDFKNAALEAEPSLLVITGLTPNSQPSKLEKARDLLERHHSIPRIVVIAGEDPITFMSTRLYSSLHSMYFYSSTLVKRKVEIL